MNYESSTRTFLRIMWFIDFLFYFFTKFNQNYKESTSSIGRFAYKNTFSKIHPYYL